MIHMPLQETKKEVGTIMDVHSSGASDLLRVRLNSSSEGKDVRIWIPFVKEIVPLVDNKARRVEITPPEGLLELNVPKEGLSKKDIRKQVCNFVQRSSYHVTHSVCFMRVCSILAYLKEQWQRLRCLSILTSMKADGQSGWASGCLETCPESSPSRYMLSSDTPNVAHKGLCSSTYVATSWKVLGNYVGPGHGNHKASVRWVKRHSKSLLQISEALVP